MPLGASTGRTGTLRPCTSDACTQIRVPLGGWHPLTTYASRRARVAAPDHSPRVAPAPTRGRRLLVGRVLPRRSTRTAATTSLSGPAWGRALRLAQRLHRHAWRARHTDHHGRCAAVAVPYRWLAVPSTGGPILSLAQRTFGSRSTGAYSTASGSWRACRVGRDGGKPTGPHHGESARSHPNAIRIDRHRRPHPTSGRGPPPLK